MAGMDARFWGGIHFPLFLCCVSVFRFTCATERILFIFCGFNRDREEQQERFALSGYRVFLAQLDAASEAIDLSAAAELWFVETTFSPKTMRQMGSRISNVNQTKNTFVKVCYIEVSIDESIQASLLRLWSAIKEVTHG